ncbi:MAG: hypothetical protein IKZ44_08430 [Clostridia bacterium]|nr:hypothetical protein [Clostridia bacterium]
MNDRQYYHAALECALLDSESLEKRINARIARISKNKEIKVRFPKRLVIALVAAAVLLIAGTAFAIGISRMQQVRDGGLGQLENYTGIVYGTVAPDAEIPSDPTEAEYYVPVGYDVGMTDESGSWQPDYLKISDVSAKAGAFTVTLDNMQYNPAGEKSSLIAAITIEADADVTYSFSQFTLTVNGKEIATDNGDEEYWQQAFELEKKKNGTYSDMQDLFFRMPRNPIHADTTFTITSEINGEPFTLTYTLTAEQFEALRQDTLDMLDNYAALLNDVPTDTILVGAEARGYRVTDIIVKGHWLYYTVDNIPEYFKTHETREPAPYGKYDLDGAHTVVDGMLSPRFEFISAENRGEYDFTQLFRCYLPYPDALPKESLVSIFGAVFRVEWATGKATVPKDEAEYLAWRQESEALSAENGDYDAMFIAKPDVKADTFTVKELVYMNHDLAVSGMFGLILETDEPVKDPFDGKDRQPVVTVNGVAYEGMTYDYDKQDKFDGGTENGGKRVGFLLYGTAYRLLPETFDVTVTWNGSSVTFTMQKSDLVRCYDEEIPITFGKLYSDIFGL